MLLSATNSILFFGTLVLAFIFSQSIYQSNGQPLYQSINPSLLLATVELGKLIATVLLIRLPWCHRTVSQPALPSINEESESDRESLLSPRNKVIASQSRVGSDVESDHHRGRSVRPIIQPNNQIKPSQYRPGGLMGTIQSIYQTINQTISGLLFSAFVLAVFTSIVSHLAVKLIALIGLIDCLIICSISLAATDVILRVADSRANTQSGHQFESWPLTILAGALVLIHQLNERSGNQTTVSYVFLFFVMSTMLMVLQTVNQSINQSINHFRFGVKHSNQLIFGAGFIINLWVFFISQSVDQSSIHSADQLIDLFGFRSVCLVCCLILGSLFITKVQTDRSYLHAAFLIDCLIVIIVSVSIKSSSIQSTSQSQILGVVMLLCASYMRLTSNQPINQPISQANKQSLRLISVMMGVGSIILLTSFVSTDRSLIQPVTQTFTVPVPQPLNLTDDQVNEIIQKKLPMVTYQSPSQSTDFTIIIPSYHGHLDKLLKYLTSMRTYCDGCTELPVVIITGINEKPLFTAKVLLNPDVKPYFKSIKLATLPEISHYWKDRTCDDAKDGNPCFRSRHIHQSLKKMYGCLSASTRYCWVSDSESLFIRPISVRQLLQDYIDQPTIITSTWLREHYSASRAAREALGIASRFGWLLEYYMWVFDRSIFAEVEERFRARYPLIGDLPEGQELFIEVVYYAYILHNQRRFPQYKILDTADMFGPAWWAEWKAKYPDFGWGVIEDVRVIYDQRPEMRPGIDAMYDRYGLKAYKSHGGEQQCNAFVDNNPGVVLLLSEQPGGVYEQAMKGRYLLPHHPGYANRTAFKPENK